MTTARSAWQRNDERANQWRWLRGKGRTDGATSEGRAAAAAGDHGFRGDENEDRRKAPAAGVAHRGGETPKRDATKSGERPGSHVQRRRRGEARAAIEERSTAATKSGERRRGLHSHRRREAEQTALVSNAATNNGDQRRGLHRQGRQLAPPPADATSTRSDGRGPNSGRRQRFQGLGGRFRGERDSALTENRSRERDRELTVARERETDEGESGENGGLRERFEEGESGENGGLSERGETSVPSLQIFASKARTNLET
ncbi:hypothetical protein Scep_017214 [Stephania cephalantha]|uniref:Uncharacterized protein n=1 Tax=Stephania cephalantha TaxID=152367 RepID=A0AAP0IP50_9MAGN